MKSTIQFKNIIHYILIYFMITTNQSQLYDNFISKYNIIIIVLLFIILLLKRKYRDFYVFAFLAFMLYAVVFIRLYVGGIGFTVWTIWAVKILVTLYAIQYDKELFITRYIKVATFLAGVSVIGFVLGITSPATLRNILIAHYPIKFHSVEWLSSTRYIATQYYADGLLFFTFRQDEMTRNCGIFTEPGVYQMILNSALFLILFFKNRVNILDKNKIKYIVVLLLAIVTCQSTTGYMGLVAIILVFIISKQENSRNLKISFIKITFSGVILLYIDYIIRGVKSFLYSAIFNKVLNSSGSADLSASTGAYRMGTIQLSISSILKHPLGIGIDNLYALMDRSNTGFVAAQIMQTGAVMGVIPFFVILFWLFKPVIKSNMSNSIKILFVFIYFNTALAQSSEFYPTLIMIPILLHLKSKSDWKSKNITDYDLINQKNNFKEEVQWIVNAEK